MFVEAMDFQNLEMSNIWKGRVLSVNGITNHFQVARNDLKLCTFIINAFDNHSDLMESIEGEHPAFDKTYGVLSNPKKASSEEEILLGESVSFKSKVITDINIQLLKVIILFIKQL